MAVLTRAHRRTKHPEYMDMGNGPEPAVYYSWRPELGCHWCDACQKPCQARDHIICRGHSNKVWWWLEEHSRQHNLSWSQTTIERIHESRRPTADYPWSQQAWDAQPAPATAAAAAVPPVLPAPAQAAAAAAVAPGLPAPALGLPADFVTAVRAVRDEVVMELQTTKTEVLTVLQSATADAQRAREKAEATRDAVHLMTGELRDVKGMVEALLPLKGMVEALHHLLEPVNTAITSDQSISEASATITSVVKGEVTGVLRAIDANSIKAQFQYHLEAMGSQARVDRVDHREFGARVDQGIRQIRDDVESLKSGVETIQTEGAQFRLSNSSAQAYEAGLRLDICQITKMADELKGEVMALKGEVMALKDEALTEEMVLNAARLDVDRGMLRTEALTEELKDEVMALKGAVATLDQGRTMDVGFMMDEGLAGIKSMTEELKGEVVALKGAVATLDQGRTMDVGVTVDEGLAGIKCMTEALKGEVMAMKSAMATPGKGKRSRTRSRVRGGGEEPSWEKLPEVEDADGSACPAGRPHRCSPRQGQGAGEDDVVTMAIDDPATLQGSTAAAIRSVRQDVQTIKREVMTIKSEVSEVKITASDLRAMVDASIATDRAAEQNVMTAMQGVQSEVSSTQAVAEALQQQTVSSMRHVKDDIDALRGDVGTIKDALFTQGPPARALMRSGSLGALTATQE